MNQSIEKMTGLQWGIVGLTVATAIIHLVLGITSDIPMFLVLFILNGIGYLVLIAALYFLNMFAANRSLIRYVLMAFAAVTVVLYFVFNGADAFKSVFGLIDKAIEVILIILLWMDR